MAVGYCNELSPRFCDNKKKTIDSACHDLGKEAGKWIMYDINDKQCYCICSCLGKGTEITLADGSQLVVEKVQEGKTQVLAAGLDLQFKPHLIGTVSAAAPGQTKNTIYLKYSAGGKQRETVMTMDHPVLVQRGSNRQLVSAATLQPSDRLIDRTGQLIAIDDIKWGSYDGSFWELATNMTPPDAKYNGHLILTDGIVTGDFAISTFVNLPMGLGSAMAPDPNYPIVGSKEWRKQHAAALPAADAPITVKGATFVPAAAHRVAIPAYASAFLPSLQAALLEEKATKVPINNQYYLEECEWLIEKVYRPLYPDITYLFDWYSDEVNSHSWVQGDQKYIYLSGGLARIEGFEYEGVALALAHEIGHLRGKPEVAPGVTCEGQADWYAASRVLRNIWFGLFYFEYTKLAAAQLELLYDILKKAGAKPDELGANEGQVDKFGQPYPCNGCRIETILGAMRAPEQPACSECQAPPP
jgi:hypothetical protein